MALFVQQRRNGAVGRRSFARLEEIMEVPNLLEVQLASYRWFRAQGLKELLRDISPIEDVTGTRFELTFINPETGEPQYRFNPAEHSIEECRLRDLTYATPLLVHVWLKNKETGEIKQQEIFMGNLPEMTEWGTLIINGAERVVVSQLLRSPGVYFTLEEDPLSGRELGYGKLIPDRGAWLEFETSPKGVLYVKTNGKRRILITTLLRAAGCEGGAGFAQFFQDVDTGERSFVKATLERGKLEREEADTKEQALLAIYRKLRPGDPPNVEHARALLENLIFNRRRYDLGEVGRHKLLQKLARDILFVAHEADLSQLEAMSRHEAIPLAEDYLKRKANEKQRETRRVLNPEDLVSITRHLIRVNNHASPADDIDHLGNRRVRTIGELIQNQFRIGLLRLERAIKDRMSIADPKETVSPGFFINVRPVVAVVKEFFGGSQLSQFMDQTNPVAELTHKRRLSAMGPGGLSRDRAGFEVRDVHPSHYGRICPIETPEGPNIGLIGSLATYSRVNRLGFLETPLRRVYRELENTNPELIGRTLRERLAGKRGVVLAETGTVVTPELYQRLSALPAHRVAIVPYASDKVEYLSADQEEDFIIAQPHARMNERRELLEEKVEVRQRDRYYLEGPLKVDYMDVSPKQIVSVTTSLIPFLEHDDANRALMGSNMQRQAVPPVLPETPTIGTGMERIVARDSGQALFARREGVVLSATGQEIQVRGDDGTVDRYLLQKFIRTNQGTCINQRGVVFRGERVLVGQVLADSYTTDQGELALGHNVLTAYMSWEGYNFEDAIIISENVLKEDKFTSIHMERHELEARETKLGPEEITRDIPNVGEESLRNLDETGVIRIGAEVAPGDILVGKVTRKGEGELTAEDKLLRAVFGEKAHDVKDTSLRVPHGEGGKVINVIQFKQKQTGGDGEELPAGVREMVRVWLAQKRKVSVGDKMAGRHGNKGVISIILPQADMPFLPQGQPVEVVLNPIGVPSRMNLGQIMEAHLGAAAHALGYKALCPVFDGARSEDIEDALSQMWIVQRAGAIDPHTGQVLTPTAKEWLSQRGYDGERVFAQRPDGEAKRVCLRLWLEDRGIAVANLTDAEVASQVQRLADEKRVFPPTFGKVWLRDGRTGEVFDQPVTVGYIYLMKLIHLVEDKIHARSTGPYSLITQQPLGGKAQFGGQRFGEMEVWALEAYGAAYNLQELLTVKSDDVAGRSKIYEAIVKGDDVFQAGLPESFQVLLRELMSLGLAVEVLHDEEPGGSSPESMEHRRLSANF